MTSSSFALHDPNAPKPFIVTVSSRALFDLEESHNFFMDHGEKEFEKYQREREDVPLKPGAAFAIVKKFLDINKILPEGSRRIEVIVLSRNSPETGLRIFNTIEKMGLDICRAVFTSGSSPSKYLDALGVDLMLSSNPVEVKKAIDRGVAAATLVPKEFDQSPNAQLKIAFDGDAVLFDDESEKKNAEGGLEAFHEHEVAKAHIPLGAGPFKDFLEFIHEIQKIFPSGANCPIRTALVTARSAPAHKRVIHTFREWGVRIDEGMFLGGKNKGPFLEAFEADIFLDDSQHNILTASSVPSAHVPYGVRNEEGADESKFTGTGHLALAPGRKRKAN